VDAVNNDGDTALDLARKHNHAAVTGILDSKIKEKDSAVDSVKEGDIPKIKKLLDTGFDINTAKEDGTTMLMLLSIDLNVDNMSEMIEFLIGSGADTEIEDENGNTALNLAVRQGNKGAAEQLVFAGADVDTMNHAGWTPLMFSAALGYRDIMDFLISRDADMEAGGNKSWLKSCMENEFDGLIDHGDKVNKVQGNDDFFKAAEKGDWEKIKKFLKEGVDMDSRNKEGATALITAIRQGHKPLSFKLISAGINVNAKDKNGVDALLAACESKKEHADLAAFLILEQAGMDENKEKEREKIEKEKMERVYAKFKGVRGIVPIQS
jgi:uncharacterized protein